MVGRKPMKLLYRHRHGLCGLFAVLLGLLSSNAVRADEIFVSSEDLLFEGLIGAYTTSGATVNPALIGLPGPQGIAVSGSDLFAVSYYYGTIGEYTTSGVAVNPALISGLSNPRGIAISGSDLFVTSLGPGFGFDTGTVGEYTTSGVPVNPSLITGLDHPVDIAVLTTVPEPSSLTLTLFGLVLAGLVFRRWRKRAPAQR